MYIVFIVMDFVGCGLALFLSPPEKVIRKDGTNIAVLRARTFWEDLKGNVYAMKDYRLWLMVRLLWQMLIVCLLPMC